MTRILIAEDDDLISSFIEKGLRASGFEVRSVGDGELAVEIALRDDFDLLILDLALPGREGFEVLRRLRAEERRLPIIILTGRPELRDVVQCLDLGADDYMTKPFRFQELLARINLRVRRRPLRDGVSVLSVNGVQLDMLSRRVSVGGRQLSLTAREFALLQLLMRHPGQVLTRGQILARLWGEDVEPGTNVVNVYIGALRKKLDGDVIESVRGVGYRFIGCAADAASDRPGHRAVGE